MAASSEMAHEIGAVRMRGVSISTWDRAGTGRNQTPHRRPMLLLRCLRAAGAVPLRRDRRTMNRTVAGSPYYQDDYVDPVGGTVNRTVEGSALLRPVERAIR